MYDKDSVGSWTNAQSKRPQIPCNPQSGAV